MDNALQMLMLVVEEGEAGKVVGLAEAVEVVVMEDRVVV